MSSYLPLGPNYSTVTTYSRFKSAINSLFTVPGSQSHKCINWQAVIFDILMHDFPIIYSLSIEQTLFEDKACGIVTDVRFTAWLYSHESELISYPEYNLVVVHAFYVTLDENKIGRRIMSNLWHLSFINK